MFLAIYNILVIKMFQIEMQQSNTPSPAKNITGYHWLVLALNTGMQSMNALISTSTGVLAAFILADLGITKSMMGFAGGAIHVGMGFTALIAGRLADTKGEKIVLTLGGILAGLAIIVTSRSASFAVLAAMLLLTGVFSSGATPAGSKAIIKWFPPQQQGLALGIRQTGVPIGGFIGSLLLPFLALNWGWRTALVVAGVIFIVGSLGFYAAYKSKPAQGQPARREKADDPEKWAFMKNRNIWLVTFVATIYQGAQFIMITYLALYVRDALGLDVATAALCLTASQLGGIVSRIGSGYISDRFLQGARKPGLVVQGFIIAAVAFCLLLFNEKTPFALALLVSFFFGASAMGWNGLFIALLTKLAGQDHGGAAVGLGVSLIHIGTLTFPPLFGLLIDISGSYSTSWIVLAVTTLAGLLLFIGIHEPPQEAVQD